MISVVMAVYNGEAYLLKQLLSIKEQTRKADEVLIFDDCSTDQSSNIITAFIRQNNLANWTFTVNSSNKGYFRNFIDAIKQAKGELVFLSDQDDIWLPGKLEEMERIFLENPDILSLSSEVLCVDSNDKKLPHVRKNKNDKTLSNISFSSYSNNFSYPGMAMAFRKEMIPLIMEIAPGSGAKGHDWLINVIASAMGKMFIYHNILGLYRLHDNNAVGINWTGARKGTEERISVIDSQYQNHLRSIHILQHLDRLYGTQSQNLHEENKKVILYEKRIENLKGKKLLRSVLMIRYLKLYHSFKTYCGDIAYMLGLAKHIKR